MANATGFNLKNFYNILTQEGSILYAYQFAAEFNGLNPDWGITDSSDAAKNISYFIQAATIPGTELTKVATPFLGTEFKTPGVKKFTHSWTANIILTQDLNIYKGFRRWQDNISNLHLDGGGNKAIPDVNLRVSILDPSSQKKTTSFVLEGVWVKKVGEMALKYNNGGGDVFNQFPIEFRYQYVYKDDSFNGNSDPLRA